jgi:antirestriction protein ArdC
MKPQDKMNKGDVYQYVTDRMIDRLEAGEIPWVNTRSKPLLAARSYTTGNRYRGINAFLLSMQNGASPFWITFRTAKEAGGNVRKGAKSQIAVFWKLWETKEVDERGNLKSYPILRYYNVFSLDDCEGIACPLADEITNSDPLAAAEEVVKNFHDCPRIDFGASGRAFYRPGEDRVVLPQRSGFTSTAAFYRTYFHELVHSTGAKSRLDRFESSMSDHSFNADSYSMEELVAEMGAAMLLAHCGLFEEMEEKNASYLFHWLKELKADPKLIVKAAGKAQKAVDYILGIETAERLQTEA